MIHDIADVLDRPEAELGGELTVRCRIQSNRIPGTEGNGMKSLYMVDDPRQSTDSSVALSFWSSSPTVEPLKSLIDKTDDPVLDSLGLPMELEDGTGKPLQRGEEVLVRAVPNRSAASEADLYLNVTSVAIRDPSQLVSKSRLRTQDNCQRENYLRYVKNVYSGDRYSDPPHHQQSILRGDAIHRIAERAVENQLDRFESDTWTKDRIEQFCTQVLEEEFGFRQALLVLSGAGLSVREHIVETLTTLFTDTEFQSLVTDADELATEEFLNEAYGYAGRVDLLVDGTPYDIKSTRDPDDQAVWKHSHQVRLYTFALILESLEEGESLTDAIDDAPPGMLIYPNTSDGTVRFEPVDLEPEHVGEFLELRNKAVSGSALSAPSSPYNRDCEDCQFAVDEWISGPDDALAPACTFHCQNERRWPCYELDGGEVTTECSRFDDCEQRLQYRDSEQTAYYNRQRKAFRTERRARRTATQVLEQFDRELLHDAGFLVPSMNCIGATAAGTVFRFESDVVIVPAFEPGESVTLQSDDGTLSATATYYGEADGAFLFKPDSSALTLADVLGSDASFEALYRFAPESVDRKFLPYLDFAERRGIEPGFADGEFGEDAETDRADVSDIADYLDKEAVFVDLPIHRNRAEKLAELVGSLVTATYPAPDSTDVDIPDPASRVLVLGSTPKLVETAVAAQPTGPHYRLDGTGGGDSVIDSDDSYHEIQTKIGEARSLVSSTHVAMSDAGPDGISEFFHRLAEGDYKDADDPSRRDHSGQFFDAVVILGGEQITEPEFHFLSDLADRVVVVGDTRRGGPTMVSSEAADAGLDRSYFTQAFDQYQSFPSEEAVSLQLSGEAPPAIQSLYPDGPWEAIDGDVTFLSIDGDEETALDAVELTTTVQAEHAARRLVFDVTDTPVSPIEAQELFQQRLSLDATKLTEGSVVLIDDMSLYLVEKDDIEGERTNDHEVVVRADAAELPQFNRALLTNSIAEQIVAQVAESGDIDVVVTPFEAHATAIKRELAEAGVDVPVRRPEALPGTCTGTALVSFAVSNESNIVRSPLDSPTVLYELLSAGWDVVLVGNKSTLSTKDYFAELLNTATSYES
ncbi:PD-(D/E)XK nuclease family protein [Candidatus Halobonum tyrrellensis]|uniref:PD-(D/E)XK endonuclease-like domain-containing protein n=1 Tax=Candidatus Halobonum tyrrellensis G22 TaxID=1324957 RepID=V4GN88_9EURY|nr:DNA2/NAM7 family helicase [Candidatus Halobonum tyrrellensis]ESP86836.1 hypothetical protein K933_17172 [Candidatus Halobonum tyrrellensis G22]